MFQFFKNWLGEWKSDEQLRLESNAAYDAFLRSVELELEQRRKVAIAQLGEKWLMHPTNHVTRKLKSNS